MPPYDGALEREVCRSAPRMTGERAFAWADVELRGNKQLWRGPRGRVCSCGARCPSSHLGIVMYRKLRTCGTDVWADSIPCRWGLDGRVHQSDEDGRLMARGCIGARRFPSDEERPLLSLGPDAACSRRPRRAYTHTHTVRE